MKPVICSFYTSEYIHLAERMVTSARKFGYETDVIPIEKINGRWLDTVYWRPIFLAGRLRQHKRPVVWLDCDAVIEQDPLIFESLDCDFAAHTHDFPWCKNETLGGTMYFSGSPKCLELLEIWIDLNMTMPKQNLSQKVLAEALKKWDGKHGHLPATYCQIFDHMAHCGTPVISQHQASRQFRND